MGKRITLTKEKLQSLGVTDVVCNEDGTVEVYVNGNLKKQSVLRKTHPYGKTMEYLSVPLLDRTQKIYRPDLGKGYWTYKTCNITVNRLVYAWFKGEAPKDRDIDHIDGNTFNNHIDNLQAVTRQFNLAKRLLSHQEIAVLYRDKERRYNYTFESFLLFMNNMNKKLAETFDSDEASDLFMYISERINSLESDIEFMNWLKLSKTRYKKYKDVIREYTDD